MGTSETFLIAMAIIYGLPYLIWRLGRTDDVAPLVVVQILLGIVLGPGVLGAAFPHYYATVFNPPVIQALNGVAWWAVMLFVCIAGVELDLKASWAHRRETVLTAGFALGAPLLLGALVAAGMLATGEGWLGKASHAWQFVLGVGMACAVTALPILILFMDKLGILRAPLGQRVLRYASLDDLAIWAVLALILLDWARVGRQLAFVAGFVALAFPFRALMRRLRESDRWYVMPVWLAVCGFAADYAGLHFMVGAFLAGAVLDRDWFDLKRMDLLRHHVLLVLMPVFFLSTGLRTSWSVGGASVFVAALALLAAAVAGKFAGVALAGKLLGWRRGDAWLIGWLLQTKALIMIVFTSVLLDRGLISPAAFTALLLMAVGSTMLTVPMVRPRLDRGEAEAVAASRR